LEPQGVTGSPAYGRVGLMMDNFFLQVFSGENGFKGPKTKKFPKILDWEYEEKYFCFLTEEEAIVWKLLHIQEMQQKVMNSLKTTVESMNKKFKRLNIQKKIQNYSDKYPEHFLKNI
jgi:hypothetical protein